MTYEKPNFNLLKLVVKLPVKKIPFPFSYSAHAI